MQEYAKHIARWMLSTFLGVSARRKKSIYILKPCREKGRSFKESNYGYFCVNDKTNVEFGFRMM